MKAVDMQFGFEDVKPKTEALIISGRQPEIFNALKHRGENLNVSQVDEPDDLSSRFS